MSTLVAYATPTSALPEYADHTFVRCSENGQTFACWSGPAPLDQSVKILEASYPNAYAVADGYRAPISIGGTTYPDTAAIGIYGVNGVCHQATNCFMFASTYGVMSLVHDANGGLRPMGLVASYAAFGTRGTGEPLWYLSAYLPNRGRQDHFFAAGFGAERATSAPPTTEQRREHIVAEFAELVRRAAVFPAEDEKSLAIRMKAGGRRGVMAAETAPAAIPVDPNRFAGLHRDFLAEKDGLLKAEVRDTSRLIGEPTAERVNDLAVKFQRKLAEAIGARAYEALTGLDAGQQVRIVDPRIARGEVVAAPVPSAANLGKKPKAL